MDIFKEHEIFEIEVLERLKNYKFLEPLVFGGGTMLRLCHELPRYSADLDFWVIRPIKLAEYFKRLQQNLGELYEITDAQSKYFTLLIEIRSPDHPRRLKLEIRKEKKEVEFQERIAFSRYSTRQVVLRAHTLEQSMNNKIAALLDRRDIRDAYDLEFLLRKGLHLPRNNATEITKMERIIRYFTARDFKVTLGSVLEKEQRDYYIKNGFGYLMEKLRTK
jgi:predicted nucleotidyltransferase component of viral defense system